MEKFPPAEESQIEENLPEKPNKFGKIRKIIGTGILAGAAAIGGAMHEKGEAAESPQKAKIETSVLAKNEARENVGKFTAQKIIQFMRDHYEADVNKDDVAFGDLNGDREKDAAFLFSEHKSPYSLGAVLNKKGEIGKVILEQDQKVLYNFLYDSPGVPKVKIESGDVVVQIFEVPENQNSTPGKVIATKRFKIVGNVLIDKELANTLIPIYKITEGGVVTEVKPKQAHTYSGQARTRTNAAEKPSTPEKSKLEGTESSRWSVDVINTMKADLSRVKNKNDAESLVKTYFNQLVQEFYFPTKGNITKEKTYGVELGIRKYAKDDSAIILNNVKEMRSIMEKLNAQYGVEAYEKRLDQLSDIENKLRM